MFDAGDHVTIDGTSYSGTVGPTDVEMTTGTNLTWAADGSVTEQGWTICVDSGFAVTTAAPTESFSQYWEVESGTQWCEITNAGTFFLCTFGCLCVQLCGGLLVIDIGMYYISDLGLFKRFYFVLSASHISYTDTYNDQIFNVETPDRISSISGILHSDSVPALSLCKNLLS